MIGLRFSQQLETVPTVHDLARHLERFLNAGYAVWTERNGASVLLPDTVGLQPYQSLSLELLVNDHHAQSFRVKGKEINATFDLLDCSLLRGAVKRKVGGLIVYWHRMARSKLIAIAQSSNAV